MTSMQYLETRLAEVENECRMLNDIEAIRRVRYTYWRCVSEQRMTDLANLFATDACFDPGIPGMQKEGRTAIAEFFESFLGPRTPAGSSYPGGFNHQIEITGDNTARAYWLGEAPRIDEKSRTMLRVGFIYHEEYVREEGEWKISSLRISSTYRELTQLAPELA